MTKFIFFGRLVKEKGIEIVLDCFAKLYKKGITNRYLDIYGVGAYEDVCTEFAQLLPNNVAFHGRCEGENRAEIFPKYDFCLMPSLIIESFGLTALESLKAGVPVIGFKKGGVEPFITHDLNISEQAGANDAEKLLHMVEHILSSSLEKKHYLPNIAIEDYSTNTRFSRFQQIAGNAKRILIVSDFIKRIGGIENYIHDVQDLLRSHGYEIELRGQRKKNSFKGLFKTAFNISARRSLRKKIREYKPDLVRCHSVSRGIGRLPITAIPHNVKVLMMFHDMGYFMPRASRLYQVHHTPTTMGLLHRIRQGNSKNPLQRILLTLKRISLQRIKIVFRHRDTTYLVPSEFMKPFSENLRSGKDQNTIILSHFVK